ncbi:MAG: 2-oxo acid dehydrogenase subunit E2, partial [Pseudomonadota bacterium]
MSIEVKVPTLGESVTEATVGQWFKKQGDAVAADEPIVELETDKVTVEVPAPAAGRLSLVSVQEGDTVEVGTVIGQIAEGEGADAGAGSGEPAPQAEPAQSNGAAASATSAAEHATPGGGGTDMPPSPSARKILDEKGIDPADVNGSGRRGQVLKEDAMAASAQTASSGQQPAPASYAGLAPAPVPVNQSRSPAGPNDSVREERVKMSRLRQTIATRLKDAQNTAAMLTTFNDVDMTNIMAMRSQYKDQFEKRHGVKLGFMGFFVKACVQALADIPAVNAEIDGNDIIYKNYYHVGVAVGTDKGLVVPVIREADRMSLAEIEMQIADFGQRARNGKLGIDEMQ